MFGNKLIFMVESVEKGFVFLFSVLSFMLVSADQSLLMFSFLLLSDFKMNFMWAKESTQKRFGLPFRMLCNLCFILMCVEVWFDFVLYETPYLRALVLLVLLEKTLWEMFTSGYCVGIAFLSPWNHLPIWSSFQGTQIFRPIDAWRLCMCLIFFTAFWTILKILHWLVLRRFVMDLCHLSLTANNIESHITQTRSQYPIG